MTEQKQPEALRLAETLEALGDYNFATEAAAELRRQHAEIESLQESYTKRAREWRDFGEGMHQRAMKAEAKALRAAQPAPAAQAASITLDFKQATELLEMFGGEPGEITLTTGDGHSGKGLYEYCTDQPQEGAIFLGVSDEEATPEAAPAAAPIDEYQRGRRARITEFYDSLYALDKDRALAALHKIAPQPAPGAGDQVQMILKHRLIRKVEGDWLAASEFMTGEPDPSWLAKTGESPEEWRIEQARRVSGEQIQAGLTRAFASWKKPAPAAVVGPTNKVLWLLMAQYGLNMTVGQDMDNLLDFGRDVWNAALSTTQPAPAAQDDANVQPSTCTWSLDDEDEGTWASSCGELWLFNEGGPKENRVKYCHHCGKPVDVASAADIFGDAHQPSQEPPPLKPMCCRCYDESDDLLPANCSEKPELLTGAPLGMYHCPDCGAMVCAGFPHGPLCRTCHDRKPPGFDCDHTSAADKKEPTNGND